MKVTGMEELQRKLDRLQNNVQELNGSVPLRDILTPEFMSRETKFSSVKAMFESTPFKIESQDDFRALAQDQLDAFIREHTKFSSWQDLLKAGGLEYAKRKLGS